MSGVKEQLEEARRNLLDMTLRNKLLNFKEYKRSTVTIVDEIPAEVFDRLVFEGKPMNFLPEEDHPVNQEKEIVPEDEAVEVDHEGFHKCLLCEEEESLYVARKGLEDHIETEHGVTFEEGDTGEKEAEKVDNLWDLPGIDESRQDRHTDRYLQTSHPETGLQKRLYNIDNRAEALIEDAGYNALHLAIGFLEWTEAEAHEDANRAPLVLVPVALDRDGAQSAFEVSWNEEEASENLSLQLKLSEQGFELPELDRPEEKSDIREYLETVEEETAEFDDWKVVPDIHLGFFDFTKFIMYQDLDPEGWEEGKSPADHPLIRGLLDPETTIDDPGGFDPSAIDEELAPLDVHHVMDADPSQIAAIEDVKRGRNLVIEGPPGTGKSQTIVNMIAELLSEDKTVLFVSEKLAALDVVKDRLDTVNTGDFCLELHSDKASKSDFLDELERLAKVGEYNPDIPTDTFDRLEQRQSELNAYASALGSPYGELEWTPFELFGQKEEAVRHFESKDREFPRVQISNPEKITPDEYQKALSNLEPLQSRLDIVAPVNDHHWYGCHPGQVLPQDRAEIEFELEETSELLGELQIEKSAFEDNYSVHESETIAGLTAVLEAAMVLHEGEPVEPDLLRNSEWNSRPTGVDELIDLVEEVQSLDRDVGQRTNPQHVDREIPELLTEFHQLTDSFTKWMRPRWYRLRSRLSTLYDDDVPDKSTDIIEDLENLIELIELREELERSAERGTTLFGSLWQGETSDVDQLRSFSDWIVQFRQNLLENLITEDSIEFVSQEREKGDLHDRIDTIREQIEDFEEAYRSLANAIGLDESTIFGDELEQTTLEEISAVLETWISSADELERWSRFDQTRQQVQETKAKPLVEPINDGTLEPDDVIPCFEGNLADSLLNAILGERSALAQFDEEVHEDRIDTFQELDERSLELNQKRVLATLIEGTPQLMEGASKSSQAGLLFHEFGKQRMHKPIRVLLQEAGELIQQMKPCFMMSPLSVAKYLDPGEIEFDVVIFDEASQVRPEDALGTILRGNQLVLLGDTKQLPPTSFFDQVVDQRETEDQWQFNVKDVESILDLCRSPFPSKRLKWHYRSRHESLIAVSNQEFYDNELLIYPSPIQDSEELGLEFKHLPDTVYDRGASSVNRREAKCVAEAAVEHYRDNPSTSLGVGTFSQAQQEAVLEEVEHLRKENPEIDEYFSRDKDESFFVKNLERIQGDERDVIFISVGYGFDADGNFSHNFGPLNSTGGWRRLNVLITRARERCVVFSNFTADAIDLSSTNARGVESLKVFMDYAENRNLRTLTDVGEDPDSPFERSVLRFLREEGYDVHPQVGCAGFRIDLAVPDPGKPGRYVLGIECDGASYHSSPVARARDRQRQAILEDRGWDIYRIWSTDWYRNRKNTKEKLLRAVEKAVDRGALDVSDDSVSEQKNEEMSKRKGESEISIEDLQDGNSNLSVEDLSEPYTSASSFTYAFLSDYDVSSTRQAVTEIVAEEGPIHRELLAKRLINNSNADRRGKKIKLTIKKAIQNADQRGDIRWDSPFLYPPSMGQFTVRRRDGNEANIEWITDEEIEEALKRVLENQYATARDELISQTARVLGFDRTGKRIVGRIDGMIEDLSEAKELTEENGLVNIS